MKLKPYPKYKDSGVSWLGEIPAHWSTIRTKYLLREMDDRTPTGTETLLSMRQIRGLVPHHEVSNKPANPSNLIGYKRTHPNDIVVNRMRASIGLIARTPEFGLVSPDYAVFRPIKDINTDYFTLLFKAPMMGTRFRIESKGLGTGSSGFLRLYSERLGAIPVPLPPRNEQDQLLAFIQLQDLKIRRFIRTKRSLIKLLNEQKQVIINQIVTHGFDRDVSLKDSGVSYLGNIPTHWEVKRFRYLLREVDQRSKTGEEEHLSMSQKHGGLIRSSEIEERRLMSENYAGGKLCQKGDIVLNRLKAHLGVFALAPFGGVISPDYTVLRPLSGVVPEFYEYLLKSQILRPELIIRCKGIVEGFWRLYTDDFYEIKAPVPSAEEQLEIVQEIEKRFLEIDLAISRTQREIDLIQEYRARLVSDVVIGKIDVRDIEIPALSDEDVAEDFEDEDLLEEAEAELEEDGNTDE